MKIVTVFDGSPRKKHTYQAVNEFLAKLDALGGVQSEIVRLADYRLGVCKGCQRCFDKGEEFCPLKDDRDLLFGKIMASDGVVFATPTYSFQVSGLMKLFLDRCGFLFHRPRFHGRTFTSLVVQGIMGGGKVVRYLDFVGSGLGFDVVRGACCMTREPMTEERRREQSAALAKLSERYHRRLARADHVPTLKQLMVFRMARNGIRRELDDSYLDYRYYAEKGWFESDYYHPAHLGLMKRGAGWLFDTVSGHMNGPHAPR